MDIIKQEIPNAKKSYFKQTITQLESLNTKIFIGYCRTSCDNQGNSLVTQEFMIEKYCKDHNYYLYSIYYDSGFNGNKSRKERPGFDNCLKMIDNLKENNFECALISIHQDRIFRSAVQMISLKENFFQKNIGIYLVNMNCDVTKEKKLEFELSAITAETEIKLISERVKNNIACRKAKANGEPLKTCARFGESKNPNPTEPHFINEKEMEVVNYIRSLREKQANCKMKYIIDLLNQKYPPIDYGVSCWRPTNIQRIIAYYNMPGAKPNYIYKKKNKDVKIEDSDEDNSSQTSLPISTLNINDDNDSDNSTD